MVALCLHHRIARQHQKKTSILRDLDNAGDPLLVVQDVDADGAESNAEMAALDSTSTMKNHSLRQSQGGQLPQRRGPLSFEEKLQTYLVMPLATLLIGYLGPSIFAAGSNMLYELTFDVSKEGGTPTQTPSPQQLQSSPIPGLQLLQQEDGSLQWSPVPVVVIACASASLFASLVAWLGFKVISSSVFNTQVSLPPIAAVASQGDDLASTEPNGTRFTPKGGSPPSIAYVTTYSIFFDAARELANPLGRAYFFEDVVVSIVINVLSSVPVGTTGGCTAFGVTILLCGLLHLAYLVRYRPYDSQVELGFAFVNGVVILALAVASIGNIYTPAVWTPVVSGTLITSSSVFFVQSLVLGAMAYFKWSKKKYYQTVVLQDGAPPPRLMPTTTPAVAIGSPPTAAQGRQPVQDTLGESMPQHNPLLMSIGPDS
jgi:hypothetical protein